MKTPSESLCEQIFILLFYISTILKTAGVFALYLHTLATQQDLHLHNNRKYPLKKQATQKLGKIII